MAKPGKAPLNIRSIARKHTEEAIETLLYWMRQRDNAKASVSAAEYIVDRGWGKPSQAITGKDEEPIQIETVSARDELNRRIAGIAARTGKDEDTRRLN